MSGISCCCGFGATPRGMYLVWLHGMWLAPEGCGEAEGLVANVNQDVEVVALRFRMPPKMVCEGLSTHERSLDVDSPVHSGIWHLPAMILRASSVVKLRVRNNGAEPALFPGGWVLCRPPPLAVRPSIPTTDDSPKCSVPCGALSAHACCCECGDLVCA